jgi:putative hemolysin
MELWLIVQFSAVILLILLNGCLAGAEISLISANRMQLAQQAEAGDRRARLALDLAQNPSRFLSAVQLAVALLNTLAAVLGGVAVVDLLTPLLASSKWGIVSDMSTVIAVIVGVVGYSILSVAFGELLPKRFAAAQSVAIACNVARPLHGLSRLMKPLIWCLTRGTDAFALLWGMRPADTPATSLQEIRHQIEMGTAEGVVDPVEQKLAFEALQLGDRTARQIMKPRVDIDAVDVETPPEELLGVIAMAGFSRLPVYESDLDHIIGFVHLKDVLRQHYLGWKLDLRKLIRPALTVPDTMRLDRLLVRFQEQHNQLAIVVDEFGATRGMVTLEDVIEELVGELLTEHHQRVEQQIVERGDTSWLVDGSVSIADLLERLGRPHLLADAPRNVSSVAGLVLELLGRLPAAGEKTSWHDLELQVVDLDDKRIDKVQVTAAPRG